MICQSYVSFQLRSQQHGEWQRSVESMLRSIEQQLSTASTVMTEAPVETLDAPEVRRHGELVELGQDDSRNLPRAAGESMEKRHPESAYTLRYWGSLDYRI